MQHFYLDLSTTDATFNLALEQYLFDTVLPNCMYFLLWQNQSAVIVGKHQNTYTEVNDPFIRLHNIQVVRRISGGGAVYHDLGNLNYSIIVHSPEAADMDYSHFCIPVIEALSQLGVHAQMNGRNDLTIDGMKFSGNAQHLYKNKRLHHGTLLFDSDLETVSQALNPDIQKLQAKGISSVRSRVTNIRNHLPDNFSIQDFRSALLKQLLMHFPASAYEMSPEALSSVLELQRSRYHDWNWNYGHSPECTLIKKRRVEGCGTIEMHLTLKGGTIHGLVFYGDFFNSLPTEELSEKLTGIAYTREACGSALQSIDTSLYFTNLSTETFLDILCQ